MAPAQLRTLGPKAGLSQPANEGPGARDILPGNRKEFAAVEFSAVVIRNCDDRLNARQNRSIAPGRGVARFSCNARFRDDGNRTRAR
jgi:hypothetical protein